MDRSALPRRRGQPRIGGNLLSVAERAEQTFRPERGGRLGSNASQRQQQSRWRWHAGARLRLGQHGIALGLDSLDLFDQELEPIELSADLGLQALRKGATIARDQLLETLPAVAVQGLVVADPLGEQKPLDAIDVLDPFGRQGLALTTDPAPILLVWSRGLDHRTNPGLAPLVGQQGPHQSLTVDPVGLRPPPPTGRRDGGGIDDMALDPFALQDAVDPEPVQPRFLDDDDRKDVPRPDTGFLLELGQARQKSGDVTAAHRMLRHLLTATRSEGGDDPG